MRWAYHAARARVRDVGCRQHVPAVATTRHLVCAHPSRRDGAKRRRASKRGFAKPVADSVLCACAHPPGFRGVSGDATPSLLVPTARWAASDHAPIARDGAPRPGRSSDAAMRHRRLAEGEGRSACTRTCADAHARGVRGCGGRHAGGGHLGGQDEQAPREGHHPAACLPRGEDRAPCGRGAGAEAGAGAAHFWGWSRRHAHKGRAQGRGGWPTAATTPERQSPHRPHISTQRQPQPQPQELGTPGRPQVAARSRPRRSQIVGGRPRAPRAPPHAHAWHVRGTVASAPPLHLC